MVFVFMILFVICSNVLGEYNDKEKKPTQLADLIYPKEVSNYFFIPNNDQNGQNTNSGPQIFTPPQIARISPFRAPDQFKFVPPEQQPYRRMNQEHQQPPVLFDQPEFAVIEPIVPIRPQYPHYLRELLKQQGYIIIEQEPVPRLSEDDYSGESVEGNELPPITKNNFNSFGRNSRYDNGDVEIAFGTNKLGSKQ